MTSHLRGHAIEFDAEASDPKWVYIDTGEPTEGNPRPCGHCNLPDRDDGHDACLGELPGVRNACCGHGEADEAYVQFHDIGRPTARGEEALAKIEELRRGELPPVEPSFRIVRAIYNVMSGEWRPVAAVVFDGEALRLILPPDGWVDHANNRFCAFVKMTRTMLEERLHEVSYNERRFPLPSPFGPQIVMSAPRPCPNVDDEWIRGYVFHSG